MLNRNSESDASGNCIVASLLLLALSFASVTAAGATGEQDLSPRADEQQLPRAMPSRMKERPTISVGVRDADIVGHDNRALQAAVDYIANLGGGVVEIGAGEFLMNDPLHLRSFVTVRGLKWKTILR